MDIFSSLFSGFWSAFAIILFFGGSIFVHELGHFLAARRRGLKVERFSIGFGPKMFGWIGKDGVDYRVSWLPLGGYVALPQLADMRAIEGEVSDEVKALPPPSYTSKMLVFVAGAVFNLIFAFILATLLWIVGKPVTGEEQTNRIGHVRASLVDSSGESVPGPGLLAGLQPGDAITAIDGRSVSTFSEIDYLVAIGSGRDEENQRRTTLTLQRNGETLTVAATPVFTGPEKIRTLGVEPAVRPFLAAISPGSAAAEAGLKAGDIITHLDDLPAGYVGFISDHLIATGGRPLKVSYLRDGEPGQLTVTPRLVTVSPNQPPIPRLGVELRGEYNLAIIHVPPLAEMKHHAVTTWRTLGALLSPRSDIGPSKLSGPVGIGRVFHLTAQVDIRLVIWFTILVNVNLAIINLLPIPVLDGGHMVFATIGKLLGRPLPVSFMTNMQAGFMVLLLTMIVFVTYHDILRIFR